MPVQSTEATPRQLQFHAEHVSRMERLGLRRHIAPPRGGLPGGPAPVSLIGRPSYRSILRLVALKHQTTVEEIIGPGRQQPAARVRHLAAALVYSHTDLSLSAVGAIFQRDHSMVACAIRKFGRTSC